MLQWDVTWFFKFHSRTSSVCSAGQIISSKCVPKLEPNYTLHIKAAVCEEHSSLCQSRVRALQGVTQRLWVVLAAVRAQAAFINTFPMGIAIPLLTASHSCCCRALPAPAAPFQVRPCQSPVHKGDLQHTPCLNKGADSGSL